MVARLSFKQEGSLYVFPRKESVLSHSLFLLRLHMAQVFFPFECHFLRHAQTMHCFKFHSLFSHMNLEGLNFVSTFKCLKSRVRELLLSFSVS